MVSFSGSSFKPMMGVEMGAVGQELFGAMMHPTLDNSMMNECAD